METPKFKKKFKILIKYETPIMLIIVINVDTQALVEVCKEFF